MDCPIEEYEVTTEDPNVLHTGFKDNGNFINNKQGTSMWAELNDIITRKNYTFYINAKAKGGNTLHVGPLEIRIGCHAGIPINYDRS